MSLLTICQSACATALIAVPTQIVGSVDETSVALLALANDAGDELANRPGDGWVSMKREFDFSTQAVLPQTGTIANVGNSAVISGLTGIELVTPGNWVASGTGIPNNAYVRLADADAGTITLSVPATATGAGTFQFGQSDYLLPIDFDHPIDGTFWDRSRYWQMRGPLSPQQWQIYKSSVIGRASVQRRFRFRAVQTVDGLIVGGLGGSIGAAGETGLTEFRTCISIDPVPFDDGASLVFEYDSKAWCMSASGLPQLSWQADTDVGVISEYLLGLSMKWRLLERLGLAYARAQDEYERKVEQAIAQDGGMQQLSMARTDNLTLLGPWSIPETNYGGVTGV